MNLSVEPYELNNLGKINVLLGKNGCGKSTLFKKISNYLYTKKEQYGAVKYITPERGGVLVYNPSIEMNISSDPNWLKNTRNTNILSNFREQSIAQFKRLEVLFLRELDESQKLRETSSHTFVNYFNKLNMLLDNIELQRVSDTFKILQRGTETVLSSHVISSGESELISLGIECLVFEKECTEGKHNILLLDEPNVHLHADLQYRLCTFLKEIVNKVNATIIIATHDTALLGALSEEDFTHIAFLTTSQKILNFKPISEEYKKILPIFGAHPLSNIFNKNPISLVEGEDDERIWQQAVRSSNGKLKIYPCSTDGIQNLNKYEADVEEIIASVYDNAKAFSLRDRDDNHNEVSKSGIIKKFKLSCRAAENLLLSTEVLHNLRTSWEKVKEGVECWLNHNHEHTHYKEMLTFKEQDYNRKNYDLKAIRNDLMGIIGSSKAWEVAVGQTIGQLVSNNEYILKADNKDEHSILRYLGEELLPELVNG